MFPSEKRKRTKSIFPIGNGKKEYLKIKWEVISHKEWKGMDEMQEYLKIKWEVISHREWKGMDEMQEYLKIKWEVMELQVFCKYSFDSPLLHNKCLPILTKFQLLPDIVFRRWDDVLNDKFRGPIFRKFQIVVLLQEINKTGILFHRDKNTYMYMYIVVHIHVYI